MKPPPSGKKAEDFSDYAESYAAYAQTLRVWLVGYGIGAPVLFASQPAFARVLNRSDLALPIILAFLAGVLLQILLTILNKYVTWFQYEGLVRPERRASRRYRLAEAVSRQIGIDVAIDLITVFLFFGATARLLHLYTKLAA